MPCTDTGTIVYKRRPHRWTWSDVLRIVRATPDPVCADIASLDVAALVAGKIIRAVAACPELVRRAFFYSMLALIGVDIVRDWLGIRDRPRPADPKFGGAGVSGEFAREADKGPEKKDREENEEAPGPEIGGLNR